MLIEKFSQYSFILDRTARKVKQYAQATFTQQDFDITIDQWAVIKILYNADPMTQKELSEESSKDQPTLTRIIDLLIKKNLVRRIEHPTDRRCLLLQLTTEGKAKVEQLSPAVASIRMKAWENLSEEDFAHFTRILNTIHQNLDKG
ncbi:MarR family winged helix-turn-helix transcriptional regulator [Sphingobacterium psychroaquaticum]|uniref:DNA-binding transcriptional regulator, MarR family n=1 Tax=Sphingobacterium psychroaquaticum TaxID=561061 RepID=A0A1X7HYR7_9SPHI|nr:MarR family transcriptional regulator [Sphingobacterium psychroaquaticum]QBQ42148.1 MarR family transcriptional regulator [Sphingobacterium psychroaquaticum]SMG06828.1 DNA-binding transcriptional regulator, MarR family [Sphingobacterium psychroaquaticum]